MLFLVKGLPLSKDLLVQLKHRTCFRILDTCSVAVLEDLIHKHSVYTLLLQFRTNSDKEEVQGIVYFQVMEDVNPTCWEKSAVALFESLGEGRCCNAEADHLVLFIHDEDGEFRVDERQELSGIALDLGVGELNCAEKRSVGLIGQLENSLNKRLELCSALYIVEMELLVAGNEV